MAEDMKLTAVSCGSFQRLDALKKGPGVLPGPKVTPKHG